MEIVSEETRKEKDGRPPLFGIHHWWNRTPLTISRAMVLAAILPGIFPLSEFNELMGLNQMKGRSYNHDLTLAQSKMLKEIYQKEWGVEKPLILDPFSGGGSIPFESLLMGCDVSSSDYSPLACLIQQATLQYPGRYSKKMWLELEETVNHILEVTLKSIQDFYPQSNGKTVATYLYAWAVQCPECGFKSPLVSQWWLVKRRGKRVYLEPYIEDEVIKFRLKTDGTPPPGNISGGKGRCLKCNQTITGDYIHREILQKEDEILLATVTLGKHGKEYFLPSSEDLKALEKAREIGRDIDEFIHIQDILPLDEIPEDIKGKQPVQPYLKYWHKLLNPRQKILLSTLIESIQDYLSSMNKEPPYNEALITYLAFMVGKHVNRNCRSTRYDRKHENIKGAVSSPGINFLWDHTETNPFVESSGSLMVIKNEILKALEYADKRILKSLNHFSGYFLEIVNQSILQSNTKSSLIITHIPYQDDVRYGEMSDFFYVFEKSVLKHVLDLPSESPKTSDLSISGIRSPDYFNHLFYESFLKLQTLLEEDGLMVIYFSHESPQSWDYLINVLFKSGFKITALWPIHTHPPRNPILKDYASLESSLIVVVRKLTPHKISRIRSHIRTVITMINEVDLSPYVNDHINNLWDSGFKGIDLTKSLMGFILNLLSENKFMEEFDGGFNGGVSDEKNMDINNRGIESLKQKQDPKEEKIFINDILILSQKQIVHWFLDKFVEDYEKLDGPTRFYLFCRLSGLDGMDHEIAKLIIKSMDLDPNTIKKAGFIKLIKNGRRRGLRILKYHERMDIKIENQMDTAHIALNLYEMVGIHRVNSFLHKYPEIYSVLSAISQIKFNDTEKALAEGILDSKDISGDNIRDSFI